MKTKTEVNNETQLFPKHGEVIDLSTALLINGKALESQPVKHSNAVERKFKSEKEFNELVVHNSKMLFGRNTILIDASKSPLQCHVLLDLREEQDRFFFVDISLIKENFWDLFVRITKLFTLLNFPDYQNRLIEILLALVGENRPLKKELNLIVGEDIGEYFRKMLMSKPFILLLSDQERPELPEITTTYSSNWGRFAKPIIFRKYAENGDLFCTISPVFIDIDFNTTEKTGKAKGEKREKSTEADHLENTSEIVRNIYQKIKTDLLQEDASIEFNPKQYYISMRKHKNLAFFHFGKKRISLVVMYPEKDTVKEIKHHGVKILTTKVQKFWNGPSCTIIIESMDNLDEVILLLKKLIQQ